MTFYARRRAQIRLSKPGRSREVIRHCARSLRANASVPLWGVGLMPQRFLRPGITTSKRWNRCDWPTQSLYSRLITLVDDYGRYEADPELIRSHAFPFGDPTGKILPLTTVARMLRTLADKNLVILYQMSGKEYLQLLRWQERARSASKCPEPPCEQLTTNDNKCMPPSPSSSPSPLAISHTSARNGEQSVFKKPGIEESKAYGEEIGLTAKEVESWYDHFQSNGWKVGGRTKMLDWKAALRNARRRQPELQPRVDDWKSKTKIV